MKKNNIYLLLVLAIGFLLRLYNLAAIALWHDEAFSALLIKYPWPEMFQRIAADVHPPFYYIVLRFWHYIFGDSLFALRSFSLFFGMLTIGFAYLFVKRAFKNDFLAIVSALLIAVNPFQIQFSQEARMYTLGSFLILFSSWLILRAIESRKVIDWVFYGIVAGMSFLTHYFLMFSVAAQGIFLLGWLFIKNRENLRQNFKNIFWAYFVCGLVFLPYLPTFLKQFNQVQDSYWIPKMSFLSIPGTLWKMFGNWDIWSLPFSYNAFLWIFGGIFVLIFSAVILNRNRFDSKNKWLIITSFLVPFILAILLSFKRSLYLDRYFIFAGLFYLMIWAVFVHQAIKWKRNAGIILLIILVAVNIYFYQDNWRVMQVSKRPGMAGAAAYLNGNFESGDKLLVGSTFVYFTFEYYNKIGLRPHLISPGTYDIKQMVHFSGNALLNNSDLAPELDKEASFGERVWVLWTTGFGAGKPSVPINWRQIDEAGFEDVRNRGWIVATLYQID